MNPNTYSIIKCGLGFFALYFAYNTIQNFITQILEQLGFSQLGFYMLAIRYLSMCFFALIIGPIAEKQGPVKLMTISGILITSLIICFLQPVYCQYFNMDTGICNHNLIQIQLLIISFIAAYGFTAIWVGQGTYLRQCSNEGNSNVLQGIFWLFMQLSQVFGNLSAAIILKSQFMQVVFFSILVISAIISIVIFGNLETYQTVNTAQVLNKSVFTQIKSTFTLFFSFKMVALWPYIIYAGMIGAYFCGMVPIFAQDAMHKQGIIDRIFINAETAKMMIFLGIADAAGAYLFGKITNMYGKKFGMFLIFAVGFITCFYTYYIVYNVEYGYAWWFIEFAFGLCDGSVNPIIQAVLASEFIEKSEPFCIFVLIKSFSCFVFLIVLAKLRYSPPVFSLLMIIMCCSLGYITTFFFPFNIKSDIDKQENKIELLSIDEN